MQLGLGIDTGGTFTDVVLYDFEANEVIKSAKSPTTKHFLQTGIENALDQLDHSLFNEVDFVSLSTTLATNACIEGKGGEAVLILIGGHPKVVRQYGKEYGLPDISRIIMLDGAVDDDGNVTEEPDWEFLKRQLNLVDCNTDCYAVVQTWSMINPVFEQKAEALITELCKKPVVCGYELSGKLNVLKRASGALLNAKLIPVIKDFMKNVLSGLSNRGIKAPVVILRGDGSIMSLEFALKRPVETLLSGPAASIHGGVYLSPYKDQIVVDMGGTTTDIAVIKDGFPNLLEDGAVVGSWKTAVSSVDLATCGIGGDSEIKIRKDKTLAVGPNRVIPICLLASRYPEVVKRLEALAGIKPLHTRPLPVFYSWTGKTGSLSLQDTKIINALTEHPLDVSELCKRTDLSIYSFDGTELENKGYITKSGLTPTDIMHINGDYKRWNEKASMLAAKILGLQFGLNVNRICEKTYETVTMGVYEAIVHLLLNNSYPNLLQDGQNSFLKDLLFASTNKTNLISIAFDTSYVLCGLGAPSGIFIPLVAEKMNARAFIPEHAAVANALGAITGQIIVIEEGVVLPRYESHSLVGYTVRTRNGSFFFKERNEALEYTKNVLSEAAADDVSRRGGKNINTDISVSENSAEVLLSEDDDGGGSVLVELRVSVRATAPFNIL